MYEKLLQVQKEIIALAAQFDAKKREYDELKANIDEQDDFEDFVSRNLCKPTDTNNGLVIGEFSKSIDKTSYLSQIHLPHLQVVIDTIPLPTGIKIEKQIVIIESKLYSALEKQGTLDTLVAYGMEKFNKKFKLLVVI